VELNVKYIDPGYDKFIIDAEKLKEEYQFACEWISSYGIDYEKTRFGDYERDFLEFLNKKGKVEAKESLRMFFNAHLEANELIRIKNVFDKHNELVDHDSIKKTVSGQKFRNGSKKDQSRDFAFELGVATRFIKAGYYVELNNLADLVAQVNGRTLYVECKRIKSQRQLEKRVKEANKQLESRFLIDKNHLSRGMVALNLTDILNPDAMPVLQTSFEAYRRFSAEALKHFVQVNLEAFTKKRSSKSLAVLTEFSTQGFILAERKEDCSFVNCREGNVSIYAEKVKDRGFVNGFWRRLGNQDLI
jgi:hypothetical protein